MRPEISINTCPADYAPFQQVQMQRFNGEAWEAFGPIISIAQGFVRFWRWRAT
jgi:branched-chain amino acid transport system substrate-binding protein